MKREVEPSEESCVKLAKLRVVRELGMAAIVSATFISSVAIAQSHQLLAPPPPAVTPSVLAPRADPEPTFVDDSPASVRHDVIWCVTAPADKQSGEATSILLWQAQLPAAAQ